MQKKFLITQSPTQLTAYGGGELEQRYVENFFLRQKKVSILDIFLCVRVC